MIKNQNSDNSNINNSNTGNSDINNINSSHVKTKTITDSLTEVTHYLSPKDMNSAKRLFGGQLLAWLDEVAGIVARRHCESNNVTTACIDNLQFKEPCFENDIIVIIGRISYVGNTSVEVRLDTYVEKLDRTRFCINRAYFVMVCLDNNDKPTPVPKIEITTIEQQAEWESAKKRLEIRKQRRKQGF